MNTSLGSAHALWLLDANIISDLMRNPAGVAMLHLMRLARTTPSAKVMTSVIVDCEIQYGLVKKAIPKHLVAYRKTMPRFEIYPLTPEVVKHYASIRTHLERAGTVIGSNDMLIAAHALALDATLVTDNYDEFTRVPNLRVENWLSDAMALNV